MAIIFENGKDKLRNVCMYGDDGDSGYISNNENSNNMCTFNINVNKIINITAPDVVVGTIDITTRQSIITRYTLNEAQIRAFIIITDHIEGKSFLNSDGRQNQLIMCIPASAGTGKSHLIKALTEYFKVTGRISMLRKIAPTSVAANAMGEGGLTMQSFLHCLPQKLSQNRKSSNWKPDHSSEYFRGKNRGGRSRGGMRRGSAYGRNVHRFNSRPC